PSMKWWRTAGCQRLEDLVGGGAPGTFGCSMRPLIGYLWPAKILPTTLGRTSMPRKLPPHVERNHVKGHTYLSFRRGKGPRIRLPNDPTSEEFLAAYQAALLGQLAPVRDRFVPAAPGTIAALIASYMKSAEYVGLRDTSKAG